MGGRMQPLAIDSDPRGMRLAINAAPRNDDPQTPLALAVRRDSDLILQFHWDGMQKSHVVPCQFRYGTVLGGNLAMGLLAASYPFAALALYSSFVGIDILGGAAYECPFKVSKAISVPQTLENEIIEKCRRILLLPPDAEGDAVLALALMDEARKFAKRNANECVEFVGMSEQADAIKRSSLEDMSLKELTSPKQQRRLAQLLRDTQALGAVEMKVASRTPTNVQVQFDLWDLHRGQLESTFRKNFPQEKFNALRGGAKGWLLGQSLKMIPNSVAFLGGSRNLNVQADFPVTETAIGKRQGILGLVSFTSVPHPDQYDSWDADLRLGPSVYFDSLSNRVTPIEATLTPELRAQMSETDLLPKEFRAYALNVPLDVGLSFHTPVGALRFFLGYGAGILHSTSKTTVGRRNRVYPVAHLGLDWVAYMSRNLFFQTGFHSFGSGSGAVESQGRVSMNGWASGMLGIGYYFPATHGFVQSLFAKN